MYCQVTLPLWQQEPLVSLKVHYQEAEVELGAAELTSEVNPHKTPIFGWRMPQKTR